MSEQRYTEDHEWVRIEGDLAVVGITDYAQEQLGDLVHIELPEIDRELEQGDDAAVIESVKAAGDVKSPVSGTVVAVNEALEDDPSVINSDPTGDGWVYKLTISDPAELEGLMDEAAYAAFTAG